MRLLLLTVCVFVTTYLHGSVRVIRIIEYGASRAVLSRSEQVIDPESGQPVDQERDFIDHEVPVFWHISEFPFYALLTPPGAA
jgi:hypothetical protein